MSEKHYQISPIELVRWAEPLFGKGEATGLPEELLLSYEAAVGSKLPAALREYYLACGNASLNFYQDEMFLPEQDAQPFDSHLTFVHDYIAYDLEWYEEHTEEDYEELAQLRALPRERWSEVVKDHLVFWSENQGCWLAAIKKDDLAQPDPIVYYNAEDDLYLWEPFADSVQSFILCTILEGLELKINKKAYSTTDPESIQKTLAESSVDFERLRQPYPFPGGYFAHTCLDTENNTLYIYSEERENRPAALKIFQYGK